MCPPGYHHNGLVATRALGHMMYGLRKTHDRTSVHYVPKCMSCHKAIVVITERTHCFHDCIYITLILFLWDLSTLCVVDHLWPLIYIYLTSIYTIILYILNILYIYYILNFPCIVYRITYLYSEIAIEKNSFKYVLLKIKQTAYFSKEIITKTEKINDFIIVI